MEITIQGNRGYIVDYTWVVLGSYCSDNGESNGEEHGT